MGKLTPSDLPRHRFRRDKLWLGLLALGLLAGCQEETVLLSNDPIRGETVWLSIDPIQCLGNPWEQDWLLTHDHDDYPQTQSGAIAIFRDYYTGQGLVIHDVRVESTGAIAVCDGCSCSTGERYLVLVDEADEGAFLDLGFMRDDG